MLRRIAPLFLAVLVALPVVVPASAAEPLAPPVAEPATTPPPAPDPTPADQPSPSPVAATAEPTPPPDTDPAPDAGSTPSPSIVGPVAPATAPVIPDATGRYIVMLRNGERHRGRRVPGRLRAHVKADRTYTRSVRGFAAKLDAPSDATLLADPSVGAVVPDGVVELTAQTVPTGVSRVGGRLSDIAAIDGIDHRVDADVAIVDTGIAYHPDLNVAGGYNCSTTDPTGLARRERPRHARRRHRRRARQRHRRRRRRPGRSGVGRQDPQRRRLRPALVVHLRPRLDPRPARPD